MCLVNTGSRPVGRTWVDKTRAGQVAAWAGYRGGLLTGAPPPPSLYFVSVHLHFSPGVPWVSETRLREGVPGQSSNSSGPKRDSESRRGLIPLLSPVLSLE